MNIKNILLGTCLRYNRYLLSHPYHFTYFVHKNTDIGKPESFIRIMDKTYIRLFLESTGAKRGNLELRWDRKTNELQIVFDQKNQTACIKKLFNKI